MLFSKQLIYPFEPLSLICLISWQLFQLFEPFASTDKKSHFLLLSEINGFDFLLESSKFSWSAALMVITLSSVPLRLPNIQLSISQFLLVIHDSLKSNSAFPESLKINFYWPFPSTVIWPTKCLLFLSYRHRKLCSKSHIKTNKNQTSPFFSHPKLQQNWSVCKNLIFIIFTICIYRLTHTCSQNVYPQV